MATPKQIAANRQNAKLSSGPRTPDGKQISRMNALKHGIDCTWETACGENKAALAAHMAEYDREFQPLGVVERLLVDLVARKDWMLRRYAFLSAEVTNYSMVLMSRNKDGCEYGGGFSENVEANNRLHRHTMDTERSYFRHLAILEERQALRRQYRDDVAPPVTDSAVTQNHDIGFVPQSDPPGPPLPPPIVAPVAKKPAIGFVPPAQPPQSSTPAPIQGAKGGDLPRQRSH